MDKKRVSFWGGLAVVVGIFISFQQLILNSATIILSFDVTPIALSESTTQFNLEPVINNAGNAKAEDICFKIYRIPSKSDSSHEAKLEFDDCIIHDMLPNKSIKFGNFGFTLPKDTISDEQSLLIAYVSYKNRVLPFMNKREDIYWYQYTIGGLGVYSLLKKEYSKFDQDSVTNLLESNGDGRLLEKVKGLNK